MNTNDFTTGSQFQQLWGKMIKSNPRKVQVDNTNENNNTVQLSNAVHGSQMTPTSRKQNKTVHIAQILWQIRKDKRCKREL